MSDPIFPHGEPPAAAQPAKLDELDEARPFGTVVEDLRELIRTEAGHIAYVNDELNLLARKHDNLVAEIERLQAVAPAAALSPSEEPNKFQVSDTVNAPDVVQRLARFFAMEYLTSHFRELREDEQPRYEQLTVTMLAFAAQVKRLASAPLSPAAQEKRQDVRDALARCFGDGDWDKQTWRIVAQAFDDAWPTIAPAHTDEWYERHAAAEERHCIEAGGSLSPAPATLKELESGDYAVIAEGVNEFLGYDIATREQQDRITAWAVRMSALSPQPPTEELAMLVRDMRRIIALTPAGRGISVSQWVEWLERLAPTRSPETP